MQAFAYFPSIIYREEYPEWVDKVKVACDKHFKCIEGEMQNKNPGVSFPVLQTYHMAQDPELLYLHDCFLQTGIAILKEQGYFVDRYDFYVSGMWGQDIKCYGGHQKHVHSNTQISGFYFLETPQNGSYPIFHDPRPGKSMTDLESPILEDVTYATQAIHFSNVVPGTFLFFNSWLPHEITTSQAAAPSKFIHFTMSSKMKGF